MPVTRDEFIQLFIYLLWTKYNAVSLFGNIQATKRTEIGYRCNYKCVQTETRIISTHMNLNRMWQKALIQNVKVIDSNENIEYLCTQIKSQLARHANEIIIIHVKVIFYLSSYFYSWQNEQNKPTIGLFWLWLCVQVALDFLFKI